MDLKDIHESQEELVEWSHEYFGDFAQWEQDALDERLSKICPGDE